MMNELQIQSLSIDYAQLVSQLHINGISEGFISSLGEKFVSSLYGGIIESDQAFGFVAVRDGQVLGFICCAESLGLVYKQVLKKHFFRLGVAFLPKIFCWRFWKNAMETLFYPVKAKAHEGLPPAEVLSIVVDDKAQGMGVGRMLMEAAFAEFKKRNISEIKVMVGDGLQANEFYKKMGFQLATQLVQHGKAMNAYVTKLSKNNY
jgi:ribosomal protein S18 acetylase RimI-like enzyme